MTNGKFTPFILVLACLLISIPLHAQRIAIKTNALYFTTATFNAGVDARLSKKWTLDVSAGYNPFTFSGNKKLKHVLVQPEARYWLCATYSGHFIGANILYSHYNAGGVRFPFGIFKDLRSQRFQGDLGAVGLVYGYSWMLPGKRWSIEGVVGIGYGLTHYSKYACEVCGSKLGEDTKSLFMPTKLAVSVVYYLK